jgi:hypothetical protein
MPAFSSLARRSGAAKSKKEAEGEQARHGQRYFAGGQAVAWRA